MNYFIVIFNCLSCFPSYQLWHLTPLHLINENYFEVRQAKTEPLFWTDLFYDKFKLSYKLWHAKLTIYMTKKKLLLSNNSQNFKCRNCKKKFSPGPILLAQVELINVSHSMWKLEHIVFLKFTIRPKKSSLVSGNRPGDFFISYPSA